MLLRSLFFILTLPSLLAAPTDEAPVATEEIEVTEAVQLNSTAQDNKSTTITENGQVSEVGGDVQDIPRPVPGSPPPGEGAEYEYGPFESLIKKCDGWKFPEEAFAAHPDGTKVYLKVGKTAADSPFADQNLTKFTSVYGIHVVADDKVPDAKIIHVANTLAKVMDADNDGKPDNTELNKELLQFHPILFVMSSAEKIMSLMNAQDTDEGFPLELKFCPFAFDFEEAKKINPKGGRGDATCEGDDGESDSKNDRTLAFVLDHLMGRGFTQVMSGDRQKKLDKIYGESLKAGTFEPENTGCPPESDECGKVMFSSWGLSTLLGFDTCWCERAHALKFCTADALKKGETEFVELLQAVFPNVEKMDMAATYSPSDKAVLVK